MSVCLLLHGSFCSLLSLWAFECWFCKRECGCFVSVTYFVPDQSGCEKEKSSVCVLKIEISWGLITKLCETLKEYKSMNFTGMIQSMNEAKSSRKKQALI